MPKLTVALLSGGRSSERQVSLNSGDQVLEALDKTKYHIIRYDPKYDLDRLVKEADQIDVALIILHGPYGEDGTVQGLLDLLQIPYQGTGVLGSALAMNKLAAKRLYEQADLPVPPYAVVTPTDQIDVQKMTQQLGLPLVIKPVSGGSSIGMTIVRSGDNLPKALQKAFQFDREVIIEAFIDGIELTGAVIGNATLEALPLIEIIPNKDYDFFDYEAKYTAGATQEICPARIDPQMTTQAQNCALKAHRALFCKGYSRTDMILKDQGLFVLETNTIPGMTRTSLFPQAAQTAGLDFGPLLDRLIELSLEDRQAAS